MGHTDFGKVFAYFSWCIAQDDNGRKARRSTNMYASWPSVKARARHYIVLSDLMERGIILPPHAYPEVHRD